MERICSGPNRNSAQTSPAYARTSAAMDCGAQPPTLLAWRGTNKWKALRRAQQLRQLGDVGGDAPALSFGRRRVRREVADIEHRPQQRGFG